MVEEVEEVEQVLALQLEEMASMEAFCGREVRLEVLEEVEIVFGMVVKVELSSDDSKNKKSSVLFANEAKQIQTERRV